MYNLALTPIAISLTPIAISMNGTKEDQRNMRNKNEIAILIFLFIAVTFTIFSFFWAVSLYNLTEAVASGFAKSFDLSQSVGKNEAPAEEQDQRLLSSILNAEVRYIKFSDSLKYASERNIVYRNTDMAESEKYSDGSMKKAIIQIALEDLNDDGIKEILAYIIQFEYCGRGGGYCTFLVLQKNGAEHWKKLFELSTYPSIGISNAKSHGFRDIFFRNVIFRVHDKQKVRDREEITVWRWNGKGYMPFVRSEVIYDPKTKREEKTIMKWDEKSSSWMK